MSFRKTEERTRDAHAMRDKRQADCAHDWRYVRPPYVPRRVCRRCSKVEWGVEPVDSFER